jgi:hypothetical protein
MVNGICIVGSSKTGTTGVYSSVKHALAARGSAFYGMHEKYPPEMYRALDLYAPDRVVLAKLLLTNIHFSNDVVADFDKRVLIVRDPRDTLVSVMLYYPVLAVNRGVPAERIDEFTDLVREKEKDPQSRSFLELLVAVYRLMGEQVDEGSDFSGRFTRVIEFADQVDSFLLRYEDFVRDDLAPLAAYLDLDVHNTKPGEYTNIVFRSGSSGDWQAWFTPGDVEHFRPVLGPYMERFGYADDWSLPPDARLDPEQGSEYVLRSSEKRRNQIALNNARDEASVEEQLELLRTRADDGSATAAYRAVRLLRAHPELARDASEEFRWSLFAASCGHAASMAFLAECYRDGRGVERDDARARFWSREHDAVAERDRLVREARDARAAADAAVKARDDARAELAKVRRSARYQAGVVLVDAVEHPGAATVKAPLRLWRIARARPTNPGSDGPRR